MARYEVTVDSGFTGQAVLPNGRLLVADESTILTESQFAKISTAGLALLGVTTLHDSVEVITDE